MTARRTGWPSGDTYTGTLTVTLSPSARGQYIVVKTDAAESTVDRGGRDQQPAAARPPTSRRCRPNLVVTNVVTLPDNYSGEKMTIQLHRPEPGRQPGLAGDGLLDRLPLALGRRHLHPRPRLVLRPGRSTSNAQPLQPGESYTATVTATLPKGTGGNLFLYIHPDAHNDCSPLQDRADRLVAGGARATTRYWLDQFSHWAYEDPRNNVYRAPIHVTYCEPDLVISNLQVPSPSTSGQTITSPTR